MTFSKISRKKRAMERARNIPIEEGDDSQWKSAEDLPMKGRRLPNWGTSANKSGSWISSSSQELYRVQNANRQWPAFSPPSCGQGSWTSSAHSRFDRVENGSGPWTAFPPPYLQGSWTSSSHSRFDGVENGPWTVFPPPYLQGSWTSSSHSRFDRVENGSGPWTAFPPHPNLQGSWTSSSHSRFDRVENGNGTRAAFPPPYLQGSWTSSSHSRFDRVENGNGPWTAYPPHSNLQGSWTSLSSSRFDGVENANGPWTEFPPPYLQGWTSSSSARFDDVENANRLRPAFSPPSYHQGSWTSSSSQELDRVQNANKPWPVFSPPCRQVDGKMKYPPMSFGGRIVYARTYLEVEMATSELIRIIRAKRSGPDKISIGFDIEWKPTFIKGQEPTKAAVMQICVDTNHCFVLHIIHSGIPPVLRAFLADSSLIKVGMAIAGDAAKIKRDYDVDVSPWHDLSDFANNKLDGPPKQWGLASLTEAIACKHLAKPNRIRMGNWEAWELSEQQVRYAATDAFASWFLYEALKSFPERRQTDARSQKDEEDDDGDDDDEDDEDEDEEEEGQDEDCY